MLHRHACARLLPEHQAARQTALHIGYRSTRRGGWRVAPPPCSSTQPEVELAEQPWCRPLSGCAAGPSSASTTASSGPTSAAVHLPPIVALGKFDALHKGHRALAAEAANLGGTPWLVSFSGMAEVLGWPQRLPLVAPCDRRRVLATWAQHCGGRIPQECAIPFAEVRSMSPESFVELLSARLKVAGVVVGSNYRFGYRAAGTAELLQQLGPQHGLRVGVLDLVASAAADAASAGVLAKQETLTLQEYVPAEQHAADSAEQQQQQQQQQQQALQAQHLPRAISSSRVRDALAAGDLADAAECLERPYRLVASLAGVNASEAADASMLRLDCNAFLNQPPCPGSYPVRSAMTGSDTLWELLSVHEALLEIDEEGMTVRGVAALTPLLSQGAEYLTLDFL